jgi:hypothetical protein
VHRGGTTGGVLGDGELRPGILASNPCEMEQVEGINVHARQGGEAWGKREDAEVTDRAGF